MSQGATATPTPPTPPSIPAWSAAQVRALDEARAALIAWDRVRGDLPRLSLFAADDSDLEAVLQEAEDGAPLDASYDTGADLLTAQQQQALVAFTHARAVYRKQVLAAVAPPPPPAQG